MSETLRDLVVSLSLQTDNFTRNIKSVGKQIQEVESRFKLAATGVEGFERTTTELAAQLSTLERRLVLAERCGHTVPAGAGSRQQQALGVLQPPKRLCTALGGREEGPAGAQGAGRRGGAAGQDVLLHAGRIRFRDHCRQGQSGRAKVEYRASVQEVKKLSGQSTALKKTTQPPRRGLADAMTGYSMSGTGSAIASGVRTAVNTNLTATTLRSAGVNAMAGLKAGINAGSSGVISAMHSAAQAAVSAAKSELKIKSPSRVFEDEVGVMTMRGFGKGVLKETKEQARVIRNASRYLTGEAKDGSIAATSNDNRRTYNNSVNSTIQVQQMVVRDEQDIRALAVEIATLTRRQQRGKGLRFA